MKIETNSAMDRWNKILTTDPYDLNLEYHFTEKSKAVQGRIFSHPHDDWIESTSMQKKFGPYSCVHNAWKANSHCRFLHGYGREVVITFKALETDENNWIFDYGSMEPFKKCLEWLLDHTCLVSDTCPYLDELEETERGARRSELKSTPQRLQLHGGPDILSLFATDSGDAACFECDEGFRGAGAGRVDFQSNDAGARCQQGCLLPSGTNCN